ncbi:MAG: hypothetical protein Q9227_000955 [Pyrenula ochraceoflavens]
MKSERDEIETYDNNVEQGRRGTLASVNLNRNLEAKVSNPLADIPVDALEKDVEAFANTHGLAEAITLLKKGALIARDPANWEDLELEDDERQALRTETLHRWKHPILLYVTIFICSIGAAVQYVPLLDNNIGKH